MELNTISVDDRKESGIIDRKESRIVDRKESGIVDRKESGIVDRKESGIVDRKESGIVDRKESGIVDSVSMDDILVKFNLFGKYHCVLFLLIILGNAFNCFSSTNYVFAVEKATYRCKDLGNNATCDSFNSSYRCSEWEYDNPNSFVAEFQLACQEWKRTMIGTAHNFGYMFGLILIGPISDRIGRKSTFIMTIVAGAVVGLVKSFATWYWLYVALEFLEAAIGDAFSPMYTLAIEMVAREKRVAFINFCNLGYPLGGVILPLIAWLFPYWRSFVRVIYVPALLFCVYKYALDESPRWLLAKGRKKEAITILKRAAKMNKINIDDAVLQKLTCDDQEQNTRINLITLLKNTLASRTLFQRFVICTVWWITSTFVSYGMIINSVTLQGDKYWNFSIMFLIDLPGVFFNMFILSVFKRKYPLMSYFCVGAVLCLTQPFVPTHLPWLSITLYMIGKEMNSFYFNTTYLFTSELFPTYTRNSMQALCSSLGRIGSILAPQTPLLMAYWSGIPAVLFGSMALFAAILTCFVPDTANDDLPETIEQAEGIGNKSAKLTDNVPEQFRKEKNNIE